MRRSTMPRRLTLPFVFLALVSGLLACTSTSRERTTNVLEYLYPEGKPETPADLVQLQLPLNIGIAFVPESNTFDSAVQASVKQALLERVRAAFLEAEGIGRIEVVPETFVTQGGGFENVRQIRSALGIDLIALVSYDQTQFDDPNLASITYWTIVGAYIVPGNENETHTLAHATVFDIESKALLLHASGTSKVEGRTTAIDLDRSLREDRVSGLEDAVDALIADLATALDEFRAQVESGTVRGRGTPAVEVTPEGGAAGGGVGVGASSSLLAALGLVLFWLSPPTRRRA